MIVIIKKDCIENDEKVMRSSIAHLIALTLSAIYLAII